MMTAGSSMFSWMAFYMSVDFIPSFRVLCGMCLVCISLKVLACSIMFLSVVSVVVLLAYSIYGLCLSMSRRFSQVFSLICSIFCFLTRSLLFASNIVGMSVCVLASLSLVCTSGLQAYLHFSRRYYFLCGCVNASLVH